MQVPRRFAKRLLEQIRRRNRQVVAGKFELRDFMESAAIDVQLSRLRFDDPNVGDTPTAIFLAFFEQLAKPIVRRNDFNDQQRRRARDFALRLLLEDGYIRDSVDILGQSHAKFRIASNPVQQYGKPLLRLAVTLVRQGSLHDFSANILLLATIGSGQILFGSNEGFCSHPASEYH